MATMVSILTSERPGGASYLAQTAAALLREGADGAQRRVILGDGLLPGAQQGWEVREYHPRAGVRTMMWNAFRLALDAGCERLLFCEDDIRPCKNAVRRMLQLEVPPEAAFIDFHDMKELRESGLGHGLIDVLAMGFDGQGYWGNQCMLFPRRTLEWLVAWDPMSVARWDPPRGADCTLGWLLSCSPWPLYAAHLPRLVDHVGGSSAAHPGWALVKHRRTFEYPGDEFDALSL
jgi:hypothetical protein